MTMYSPEELKQKSDEPEEHQRCRKMFEDIKKRLYADERVSEHEKYFYLRSMQELYPDEDEFKVPNIESALAKHISLIYFSPDKYQPSTKYIKIHRAQYVKVPYSESEKDINWLKDFVSNQINEIESKKSHAKASEEEVELYTEWRHVRKELTTSEEYKYMGYKRKVHELAVLKIGVFFAYYKLQDYKEIWDNLPKVINSHQGQVIISSKRLLHVINRHFLEKLKFKSTKSFFKSEDIMPNEILDSIVEIIELFDEHKFDFDLKYLYNKKNVVMKNLILNKKLNEYHLGSFFPEYDESEVKRIEKMESRKKDDIVIYSNNF